MRDPPGRTTMMMMMTMIVTMWRHKSHKEQKTENKKEQNNNHNNMFCGKSLHLTPVLPASCHGQKKLKEKRGRKWSRYVKFTCWQRCWSKLFHETISTISPPTQKNPLKSRRLMITVKTYYDITNKLNNCHKFCVTNWGEQKTYVTMMFIFSAHPFHIPAGPLYIFILQVCHFYWWVLGEIQPTLQGLELETGHPL